MPSKKSRIESLSFNQAEFAELIGASKSSVTGWKKEGLPFNADGSIPLRKALSWWLARELAAAGGEAGSEWLERWRKARALREEISLSKDRGDLVSLPEVASWLNDSVTMARTGLQAVGQSLAPACVGLGVQAIRDLIDSRLWAICDDFANRSEAMLEDKPKTNKREAE